MKALKIIFTMLLLGITTNSNAQFWKKLSKRAEEAAKETVIRKVEEKTVSKTEKTMDTILNADKKIKRKRRKKKRKNNNTQVTTSSIVTSKYNFTHVYSFELKPEKGKTMHFDYFLKNNADYLATQLPDMKNKMISIMDFENNKIIMLMEDGKNKTQMQTQMDFEKVKNEAQEDISIAKTGKHKRILGYNCDEFLVVGNNFNSKVWATNEAGIKFPKKFQGNGNKKIKNQNNNWMFEMDGMVLKMTITDTSKKKPKISTITCTKLERESNIINTSDYKKMF